MINSTTPQSFSDPVAQTIFNYKEESQNARLNRDILNRQNFDCYNLKQNYAHKTKGQSCEFLPRQAMAVEQLTAFLQQGLMDLGQWFRIEPQEGVPKELLEIQPHELEKILSLHLKKNKFPNFFADCLKMGLIGSLMIVKVGGRFKPKVSFEAQEVMGDLGERSKKLKRIEKDVWNLELSLIRQEDYFPDPTGDGLYEIERIEMDHHKLIQLAQQFPDDFDLAAVKRMTASIDDLQKMDKARETNQNVTYSSFRRRVTFYECWGTLLEQNSGKVLHENCVAAIDLQGNVIRPPKPNPLWHGKSPYVTSPIIRVPRSVWHKALSDAGARNNFAINELYNLMVDGGMMAVHGIKQVHTSWLEDPSSLADGIPPGFTIPVNSQCPPGARALERVDTSAVPPDTFNMFSIVDREFQQSMLTNDSRLGSLSQRAVKATEVVASNQSLTGIMNGIAQLIEGEFCVPLIEKCWLTMAQHMNDLDSKEISSIVGEERARFISSMTKEDLFAATAEKMVYKVFGLSMTLNKIQDFRKIQMLLQSVGMSPEMMQEFKRKYSMTKLLGEVVKSLDIDEEKIVVDEKELMQREMEEKEQMQKAAQLAAIEGSVNNQGGSPDAQSQIPQMGANKTRDGGIDVPRAMNNIGMTTPA